jgi:hypothetical protein
MFISLLQAVCFHLNIIQSLLENNAVYLPFNYLCIRRQRLDTLIAGFPV